MRHGLWRKKRKKCYAYVFKIWVMKMHTSMGSVGNFSWLLHPSKCMCLCVCACVCMVGVFSRESTVTVKDATYLRDNEAPPREKLITPTKISVSFYSCLVPAPSLTPQHTGWEVAPACAAVLPGEPHQLKRITASTTNRKNMDFML